MNFSRRVGAFSSFSGSPLAPQLLVFCLSLACFILSYVPFVVVSDSLPRPYFPGPVSAPPRSLPCCLSLPCMVCLCLCLSHLCHQNVLTAAPLGGVKTELAVEELWRVQSSEAGWGCSAFGMGAGNGNVCWGREAREVTGGTVRLSQVSTKRGLRSAESEMGWMGDEGLRMVCVFVCGWVGEWGGVKPGSSQKGEAWLFWVLSLPTQAHQGSGS